MVDLIDVGRPTAPALGEGGWDALVPKYYAMSSSPVLRALLLFGLALAAPQRVQGGAAPATDWEATVDGWAAELIALGTTPGLAVALVRDGEVLLARGYGQRVAGEAPAVDERTRFRIASLSKGFTTALVGRLVDHGYLDWDDRVGDWIPELPLQSTEAREQLTVADLLSHRTGLPFHALDREVEADRDWLELWQALARVRPHCPVRVCYAYQNVAFQLGADLAFAARGRFFEDALRRELLVPLALEDTTVGLEPLLTSENWARPHVRQGRKWVAVTPKPTYFRLPAAAGVNASIQDLAIWMLAQLGHRPEVLPSELLGTLHTPQIETPNEIGASRWRRERLRAAAYGLGWRIFDYAGHTLVFHGGAVQGYRAMIGVLPDHDFGVAVLWNSESAPPSALLPSVLDRVLGLPPVDWFEFDRLRAQSKPAQAPVRARVPAARRPAGA